jgi:magnesium-transporting ATPase (P-type)
MCRDQLTPDGGTERLDPERWHRLVVSLASGGQRVIALAGRPAPRDRLTLDASDLDGTLTLIGLVGLIDPPRPEAVAAVAECHAAGIRVKMITGDHAETARAIAGMIGLRNRDSVLTGADIAALDDAALAAVAAETDVFARTSPGDKLRLVTALQSQGLTVAMTGDGVNDAPALKRADAGIAMGRKGSEAAKEAAALVLADDNFASIAAAVREGRTVYDNLTRIVSYTIPTSAGEAMTIVVALLAGMSLPITAIQILWVNLVTEISLGLALAFEPAEAGTMTRPPRRRDAPLLTPGLVWQVVFVSALFLVAVFGVYAHAVERGAPLALAQTMALNMLVVLEVAYLFYIRNLHATSLRWSALRATPIVWASVAGVVVAQLAITYLPALQRIFGTAALGPADAALLLGVGVVFFVVVETEKRLRLSILARRAARRV